MKLLSLNIYFDQYKSNKLDSVRVTTGSFDIDMKLMLNRHSQGLTPAFLMIAMAVTASAVAFTGIMVLLSVLGKTERAVGGVGWLVLLVMSMIGGGMVPLIFMPEWMQRIGAVSPIKWAIISLEGALWRNFSLQEMLLPCNILVCTGVITFLLGVVIIRKRELS